MFFAINHPKPLVFSFVGNLQIQALDAAVRRQVLITEG